MYFEEFPARIYPNQARLTHILGYLRTVTDETKKLLSENYSMGDLYGFSGIEKVYESILRGRDGAEFHLIDIYLLISLTIYLIILSNILIKKYLILILENENLSRMKW